MNCRRRLFNILINVCCVLLTTSVQAADWQNYSATEYGFSMLLPPGVTTKEREWSGGWAGIEAQVESVKLYGLAKLGTQATNAEIEKFAIQTIGIPASAWTQVDQGINQRGWSRYYTFRATQGSKLVFGGYGVGPKGSYLLYLETTPADFAEYRADYEKWYASVILN